MYARFSNIELWFFFFKILMSLFVVYHAVYYDTFGFFLIVFYVYRLVTNNYLKLSKLCSHYFLFEACGNSRFKYFMPLKKSRCGVSRG